MKRIIILAILALFIVSANSAYAMKTEDLENVLGLNVEYIYDGYCDGATLGILSGKVTGVYTSSCASCPMSNSLNGLVGKQGGKIAAGFKYTPELSIVTVVKADHTWIHYNKDGTIFNQGTWTQCAPAAGQVAINLPVSTKK
jgi:hypothetical protein